MKNIFILTAFFAANLVAAAGKRTYTPSDISKWQDVNICSSQLACIDVEEGKITVGTHDYGAENHSGYLVIEYAVRGNSVKEIKKEPRKYVDK